VTTQPPLNRVIGLPLITLYGIGTIIGAGIYVLVSEVAASSGYHTPVAFLTAAAVVSFTAFSYAELSSKFPRSAGEAHYVKAAFSREWLSLTVGLAVVATGVVSSATIARGFVGYFTLFIEMSDILVIAVFLILITLFAIWGVAESLKIAGLITLIEVGGIVLVLASTSESWLQPPQDWSLYIPEPSLEQWQAIGTGAFVAFFAFIGFEDIVNMAEEVKHARRTLPKAIFLALIIATLLYMVVAWAAVRSLPMDQLIASEAPFADLVRSSTWLPVWVITLISLLAVSNGALIQIIMGSRVLYGIAAQGLLPKWLGTVNHKTRTPINATILVATMVLISALLLPLDVLARITSFIILCVFLIVNIALFVIKFRTSSIAKTEALTSIEFPILIPVFGALCTLALLGTQLFSV